MTYVGGKMMAAVFRSAGIEARITPPSDDRTLELGGLHSSGEECYPEKVTIGDFLRVTEQPGFDPARTAFFMPTAEGPCRFGQYAPYLRQVLDELGYADIPVVSPTSKNSYDGMADHAPHLFRTMWRVLVCSDILRKLLLKTRPYETTPGAADDCFERCVTMLEQFVERPEPPSRRRTRGLVDTMTAIRDEFRAVPAKSSAKGRSSISSSMRWTLFLMSVPSIVSESVRPSRFSRLFWLQLVYHTHSVTSLSQASPPWASILRMAS